MASQRAKLSDLLISGLCWFQDYDFFKSFTTYQTTLEAFQKYLPIFYIFLCIFFFFLMACFTVFWKNSALVLSLMFYYM